MGGAVSAGSMEYSFERKNRIVDPVTWLGDFGQDPAPTPHLTGN